MGSWLSSIFLLTILFLVLLYFAADFFLDILVCISKYLSVNCKFVITFKVAFLTVEWIFLSSFKSDFLATFLFAFACLFISFARVAEVIIETGNHAYLVPLPISYSTLHLFPDRWKTSPLLVTIVFPMPLLFCHFSLF